MLIGIGVVTVLVCIIALGACKVSGHSDDRVDEVLREHHKKKKDEKSNV